jgi:hypothetical protein
MGQIVAATMHGHAARGRRWRRRSSLLTGVMVVAALVAGCRSGTTSSTSPAAPASHATVSVRVANCPVPAAAYPGTPFKPTAAPPTVSLPASVTLPEGARVFGATYRPGSTSYLVGPESATCQANWASADGGEYMAASGPAGHVTMIASAGGIGPATDLACPYIPAVLAADKIMRQTSSPSWCGHPPAEVIRQIPTGTAGLYAAVVLVPAHVKDPAIQGSGGSAVSVALYTAVVSQGGADGQMIGCTLTPGTCATSVKYFLATQTLISTRVSAADMTRMQQILASFLAGHDIS